MTDTRISYYALLFLFLACTTYAVYTVALSLAGPHITLVSPHNLEESPSSALTISGSVSQFLHVELNGRRIVTKPDGTFGERMLLIRGTNEFVVIATDRFGVTQQKTLSVVYAPHETATAETARIIPLEDTLQF
jgi:Glucodextranase, domain B